MTSPPAAPLFSPSPKIPSLPATWVRHTALPWVALLGLCVLLFFYRLGSYPLFDVDEPRYAEAARVMLVNGNWITPYFNGEVRFDKPVFFYWLIATAYQWFGISEFSARFFSAVTATLTVFMTFALGRGFISPRFGWLAALILATSIEVIGLARMSITDMTLCAWMSATTLALFLAAEKDRRWWVIAGLFSGLSILTKGPVGLVLPGGILLLYSLLTRQFKTVFLNRWFPLGLLTTLAVSLPWYILAYLQNGRPFLDALIFHNIDRFAGVVSGHDQPFYFFFLVIAAGFLPWSIFLPAVMAWSTGVLAGKTPLPHPESRLLLFSALWILTTLVFFTLSGTKLLTYILPLFPALALFTALGWQAAIGHPQGALRRHLSVSAWGLVGVMSLCGAIALLKLSALLPREAAHISANPMVAVMVVLLVGGSLAMAWQLSRKQPARALGLQALTLLVVTVVGIRTLIPTVNQVTQGSMMTFLSEVGQKPLATYELQRPSLTYYARRPIAHIGREDYDQVRQLLGAHGELYIITKNRFLPRFDDPKEQLLPTGAHYQVLKKESIYSLVHLVLPKALPQPPVSFSTHASQ